MICSKSQELCRERTPLLKKLPQQSHGVSCRLASARHKRADESCQRSVSVACAHGDVTNTHTHTHIHTLEFRELRLKLCFPFRGGNYFCSMWEDGSAASQEPGQQQAFCFIGRQYSSAGTQYAEVKKKKKNK